MLYLAEIRGHFFNLRPWYICGIVVESEVVDVGEASEILFSIFGLGVTAEVVTMWGIIALIAVISLIATHNMKERPGAFQNVVETGVEYLHGFFCGIIGEDKCRKYFSFLATLFVFIIFSNYSGLIPGAGVFSWFKAPTSSLSVTLGLGVVSFCGLQYYSVKIGVKHFFKRFVTPVAFMLPLLILDEFIKPASLALRLFGNIFGEETVTEELYSLLPIGAPILMMVLSLLFCTIQAVVFTMLTSIYLDEATEIED